MVYREWRLADFGKRGPMSWDHHGFYLFGNQGCGKSCFAAALLRDRMHPKHPQTLVENRDDVLSYRADSVRWMNAREVCDEVRRGWGASGEESAIRAITNVKILVIDDLGTERGTQGQNEVTMGIIRRVIDRCVNNRIGLIITTNLTAIDLDDARLTSRVCMLQPVKFPERDFRVKKRPDVIEIS